MKLISIIITQLNYVNYVTASKPRMATETGSVSAWTFSSTAFTKRTCCFQALLQYIVLYLAPVSIFPTLNAIFLRRLNPIEGGGGGAGRESVC